MAKSRPLWAVFAAQTTDSTSNIVFFAVRRPDGNGSYSFETMPGSEIDSTTEWEHDPDPVWTSTVPLLRKKSA